MSPRESKRYYFRTLLLHVSDANSIQDMRSVGDLTFSTYREACLNHGLLANDAECKHILHDSFQSSFLSLTEILAMTVSRRKHTDPKDVFNTFAEKLKLIFDIVSETSYNFQINDLSCTTC